MKKYEFTGETMQHDGHTLNRIRAVADIYANGIRIASKGYLGGWIEKEENLSQNDGAWVYGNAQVYGNAYVCGNAWVSGNAQVYGNAYVCDNAQVYSNAQVYGNAYVCGNAQVYGNAWVYGNAYVYGNAQVCGNAQVHKTEHCFYIGPIGSRDGTTTFFRGKTGVITVSCGCFLGTVEEFLKKVQKTHGDNKHGRAYRLAAELAKAQIEDIND